jgi:Flp pilus assembly protein CpaB
MPAEKKEKWIGRGWMLLAILVGACVLMVVVLLKNSEPLKPDEQKSDTEKSRVITRGALQAFTLLKDTDLEERKGVEDPLEGPAPTAEELKGRYLLATLKRRGEVKREIVAPKEATDLITNALADAVAVAIPATAPNSFGGSLQTGDIIDLLVAPPIDGSHLRAELPGRLRKFENLLVLGVGPKADAKAADRDGAAGAITLALPRSRLDEFASALPGATLLVTRKAPSAK